MYIYIPIISHHIQGFLSRAASLPGLWCSWRSLTLLLTQPAEERCGTWVSSRLFTSSRFFNSFGTTCKKNQVSRRCCKRGRTHLETLNLSRPNSSNAVLPASGAWLRSPGAGDRLSIGRSCVELHDPHGGTMTLLVSRPSPFQTLRHVRALQTWHASQVEYIASTASSTQVACK